MSTLRQADDLHAGTGWKGFFEEACHLLIGGGPTGVELAGAFSDLVRRALRSDFRNIDPAELKIILVQAGVRLLEPFDPELSKYAKHRLQDLGVEVEITARLLKAVLHLMAVIDRTAA